MPSLIDVGVLRDTLLPNLAFHSTLAVPAYLIGRSIDYLGAKDVLWSTGQVSNVLYTSIIRPSLVQGIPLERVLHNISRPGWVVIAGISLWGTRLAYRVISRTVATGTDDPRYTATKEAPNGWTKAFFTTFVPEAIVQSLITLAVTIPFRSGIPVIGAPAEYAGILDALAIGLWSAGFGLEVLADWQLASHKASSDQGLMRQGVWSIVRHPNYLGDQLTHFAYPLFLYANNLFNPLAILSPLTNWFFLRYIGGDKENETNQEDRYRAEAPAKKLELNAYQQEKNSFWPSVGEVGNKWTWVCAGLGVGGVLLERLARRVM